MATTQQAESTAVATVPKSAVAKVLDTDAARNIILPLLAHGVDFSRVVQETYLAAKENPEILACTQESVVRAVAKAVSWGLTIGETVHLVPFNVKVSKQGEPNAWEKRLKAVQDYKGKIELIVRAGVARSVNAECVYENDVFEMELGSHPFLRHRPAMSAESRGTMLGAYAVADLGQRNQPVIKYMPVAEIDAIRAAHSKQWKSGTLAPWYARKTAVHQLAKMLPHNARLAAVLRAFDEEDAQLADLDGSVAAIDAAPITHRIEERTGPKPLSGSGSEPYDQGAAVSNAPEPPNQFEDEDFGDELPLSDERPTSRRGNALREG